VIGSQTLGELKDQLSGRAEQLLTALLGQPSSQSARVWRWGNKGARAYDFKKNAFFDHELEEGGSIIDLVAAVRGCSFPEAASWCREWLGGHAAMPAPRLRRPPKQADRTAIVAAILKTRRPIAQTPAERYLALRGLQQWPASAAFIPARALSTTAGATWFLWPAIAFVLTLGEGAAVAVQLVALQDDGQALRGRDGGKIKRTIGILAGAAVRMPGRGADPLILSEGPETGLSCWEATGWETWSGCGSIGRLSLDGVPLNRPIAIAADDDRANAPAAAALGEAVARWRYAGRLVRLIYPWPTRRHDKSDHNDLLVAEGLAAVRERFGKVMPPPRVSATTGQPGITGQLHQ
jgi:hypothetical protein